MVAVLRASSSPLFGPVAPLAIAGAYQEAQEEAPAVAGVYLLAFYYRGEHTPYPLARASRHTGALHYLGYADNMRERIEAHRAGRGARLCRAAILAGYDLRLVRTWSGRGRDYERTLKDRHRLGAFCPECWHTAPLAPRIAGE